MAPRRQIRGIRTGSARKGKVRKTLGEKASERVGGGGGVRTGVGDGKVCVYVLQEEAGGRGVGGG